MVIGFAGNGSLTLQKKKKRGLETLGASICTSCNVWGFSVVCVFEVLEPRGY